MRVPHSFSRSLRKRVGGETAVKSGFGKGTTSVVPQATKKDSGTANPPARTKKHSARSLLFLQSLRRPVNHFPGDGIILDLDVAVGKTAPRVPCSGVIRIDLAISINSSSSSDTGVPR
jgi:hypothetical protein